MAIAACANRAAVGSSSKATSVLMAPATMLTAKCAFLRVPRHVTSVRQTFCSTRAAARTWSASKRTTNSASKHCSARTPFARVRTVLDVKRLASTFVISARKLTSWSLTLVCACQIPRARSNSAMSVQLTERCAMGVLLGMSLKMERVSILSARPMVARHAPSLLRYARSVRQGSGSTTSP